MNKMISRLIMLTSRPTLITCVEMYDSVPQCLPLLMYI